MNKQAKEDYQKLWNEFIEVLPTLVKNGAAGSAKGYTRKLNGFFTDIFKTTDENPIQTVENHPLEAFEMLKQMQNSQHQTAFDKDSMMPDDDKVNHPSHYQSYNPKVSIECIDAMRAAFGDDNVKTFCLINSFKYIYRSSSKGQNTDIKKAQWYLSKFLELGGYE